ncbi:MAG: I78 family peptidase inhibitor [Octadecabacter sp.]
MKLHDLIAPFFVLTACATPAPPLPDRPALPPTARDTCGASEYGALIGQDATALEQVLIMRQVRVIRPGQPVTMDLRPERINFDVAADNRITSIHCS